MGVHSMATVGGGANGEMAMACRRQHDPAERVPGLEADPRGSPPTPERRAAAEHGGHFGLEELGVVTLEPAFQRLVGHVEGAVGPMRVKAGSGRGSAAARAAIVIEISWSGGAVRPASS